MSHIAENVFKVNVAKDIFAAYKPLLLFLVERQSNSVFACKIDAVK